MAAGQIDITDPNKQYGFGSRLRFMENSVLSFLQAIFGTFPADPNDPMSQFYYDHDDSSRSRIQIEGQSTDNLESVDQRPKIVVSRGPVQFMQASINAAIGSKNLSLLSQKHSAIMTGSVGISCYSREDLEADSLAEICATAIEAFQPIIRKYGFLEIRANQIGQRALIRADARPELYVTPVLIKTSVTSNWKREVIDPVKLRKILLEYRVNPGNLTVP